MGGDGTVHHALQAVAGTDIPLGIVPTGTGNDVAAALGIPASPVLAATAILDALQTGKRSRVDAVRVTGPHLEDPRWWMGVLSAGFDSAVNERANRMRWPAGPRRYDLAIFAELLRLRPRTYTLELNGVPFEVDAVLATVGNTSTYGGGMRICPDADPTDGLLDVTVVGPVSRTELVRVKPRLYAGTHLTHPLVTVHRARRVRLSAAGVTAYADGEPLADLPVECTCVPGAVTMLGA
jgi:diacylglycerol kinase (ATP)